MCWLTQLNSPGDACVEDSLTQHSNDIRKSRCNSPFYRFASLPFSLICDPLGSQVTGDAVRLLSHWKFSLFPEILFSFAQFVYTKHYVCCPGLTHLFTILKPGSSPAVYTSETQRECGWEPSTHTPREISSVKEGRHQVALPCPKALVKSLS